MGLRTALPTATAIVVLSTTTQGCDAGTRNHARTEPDLAVVRAINSYVDVSFPLDEFTMSPSQRATLNTAAHTVARACAERFGFRYHVPPQRSDEPTDRVIGLIDESAAAKFGYESPQAQRRAKEAAEERAVQQQSPRPTAMTNVLLGRGPALHNGIAVPPGGCYGEARRALAGSDPSSGGAAADAFATRLANRSSRLAEADSRLLRAFRKWSRCMSDAGFSYRDPWAANDDPAFNGEDPSPTEIATARADVTCRKEFNVNGIWIAVRSAYQNQLIAENSTALRQHSRATDEQLQKAANILATWK